MNKANGIVFLIGAGPGDPDLITVKGKRLLESADSVIYDALVNELLVSRLPETVKKIFVGKRGGKPSPKQDEINRIIVSEAKAGRIVARLKGGDSLVFGRGSEEMEFLKAHGIPYEVVPGITSSIAAPTCAGIPVTHRNVSRSFAVATGHLQEGENVSSVNVPDADTVIFLMAMENLEVIVDKLLSGNKFTKKTPAALIRNGSHPDQEVVRGTLGTIVSLKNRHQLTPPAVFIVGETVRFAKTLAWKKRLPLAGIRVAVLRNNEQSTELTDSLSSLGATVLPYPVIKMVPHLKNCKKISAAYVNNFSWLILTSPNAAALFLEHLVHSGADARALAHLTIAAMGTGTSAVLRKFSINADVVPEKFVAEKLLDVLPADLSGESVLIPRASTAREILPDALVKRGAKVTILPVYTTEKLDTSAYNFKQGDYVIFTSSSTAEAFYSVKDRDKLPIHPVCMGEITAGTIRTFFKDEITVAKNATIPDLVTALHARVLKNRRKAKRGSIDT